MADPTLGVVISTYDRVDDARINMEIIRELWPAYFDVKIVHAFNGEHEWWPKPYLEDWLVTRANRGHFQGAVDLMETGLEEMRYRHPTIDYVLHLSSDTWCVAPSFLASTIRRMRSEQRTFASSAWGTKTENNPWAVGLALDFCIFDQRWASAQGMVPIDYEGFCAKHGELIHYLGQNVFPERVLALRFLQAVRRENPSFAENALWEAGNTKLCRLSEREPVHSNGRRMEFEKPGIWTHHDPAEKRGLLIRHKFGHVGPHAKKLVTAQLGSLAYYNNGVR